MGTDGLHQKHHIQILEKLAEYAYLYTRNQTNVVEPTSRCKFKYQVSQANIQHARFKHHILDIHRYPGKLPLDGHLDRWVARLLLQFQQARLLSAKLRACRTDTCLEL